MTLRCCGLQLTLSTPPWRRPRLCPSSCMKVPACSVRLPTPPVWPVICGVRRRPAPQRHHEVVAEQLGAPGRRVGGRGRSRGLVVNEEPVVEGEALRVEQARVRRHRSVTVPNPPAAGTNAVPFLIASKSASPASSGPVQGSRAVLATCGICSSTCTCRRMPDVQPAPIALPDAGRASRETRERLRRRRPHRSPRPSWAGGTACSRSRRRRPCWSWSAHSMG